MKTFISFLVALAICSVYFLGIDWALQKAQGLDLFPEKKVESKTE